MAADMAAAWQRLRFSLCGESCIERWQWRQTWQRLLSSWKTLSIRIIFAMVRRVGSGVWVAFVNEDKQWKMCPRRCRRLPLSFGQRPTAALLLTFTINNA